MDTITTDVIIIGAGPTGLSMACQLIRYGIDFIIIEKNEYITSYSKALGVHARTLEIYEQLNIAEKAISQGAHAGKAIFIQGGKIRGEFDFSNIGQGLSPFPFVLLLEQSKNEKLLYDYVKEHGKNVLFNTKLESFSTQNESVIAKIKTADAKLQTIKAKYLVGCDGPASLVRHTLGIAFEGSTFERTFYVADASINCNFQHNALHICLSKDSFVVFFPLKGDKRYRIVGVLPQKFNYNKGNNLYAEIESRIKQEVQFELDIYDIEWFSTYKVHTRKAQKFFKDRCFLAGDSAHIHSPAGAQGMNTGIQDTYNLAWKMALVIKGLANKNLLQTYNDERELNALNLLQTTDRMFEVAAGSGWFTRFFRMKVLPYIAGYLLRLNTFKRFLFPLISQIGIKYRQSNLSQTVQNHHFKIKAGERMPYFLVDDESIYTKLKQPKFHYLIFVQAQEEIQFSQTDLLNHYRKLVDFHVIQLNPKISEIFETKKSFSLLLRPDNYIGFISTEISCKTINIYFKRIL